MASFIELIHLLLPSGMDILIAIALIIAGLATVPALAYLKLLYPRGMMARIIWTIAAIALGPYMLIQDDRGQYQLVAVERVDEDTLRATVNDEEMHIKEVPENWWRFGKEPFAVSYVKGENVFREMLTDVGDAMPDGGVDSMRGGYHSYVPDIDFDGYPIRVHRLVERLREAAGTKLGDIAMEEGLREFGGNYDMSNTILVIYVVVMAVLGALAGLWFVS